MGNYDYGYDKFLSDEHDFSKYTPARGIWKIESLSENEEAMKKRGKAAARVRDKNIKVEDDVLSEKESLSKINKACEGCSGDESCCAIVGLKKAGWEVSISNGINHDGRKGIVINMVSPLEKTTEKIEPNKNTDSVPSRVPSDMAIAAVKKTNVEYSNGPYFGVDHAFDYGYDTGYGSNH